MKVLRLLSAAVAIAICMAAPAQTRQADVIYGKKMGVALTMDVFEPAKPNGIAVIWVVSGGWVSNHASINAPLAKVFTDRGMTVFQVVHGSQPKFQMPEILSDVTRSIRFIRANASRFKIDPNRIGISGASAGGHLSLMMGIGGTPGKADAPDPVERESSAVQAIACFFPPTDMLNYGGPGIRPFRSPMMRPFMPAFGVTEKATDAEMEALARQFSPIYGVTEKMPPTFIMHGDKDFLVPLQQAQVMDKKLEEAKVPHQLVVKTNGSHGWPDMDKDLSKLADWFEKHLGKKS